MAREFSRTDRLAEQIQRELATLLLTEVKDPRLRAVLVSGVELSRDLAHARVYLTLPAGPGATEVPEVPEVPEVMEALDRATGYLRRELGRRLHVRAVPELAFEQDTTLDQAERIDRLLSGLRDD